MRVAEDEPEVMTNDVPNNIVVPETVPRQQEDDSQTTQEHRNFTHNEYIGTEITHEKEENIFRLHGGNPNGFNLGISGGDYQEYCEELKRYQTDTACLYKINIDTQKHKTKEKLHKTSRNIFDNKYRINFASSSIPSQNEFKPGGTMIATMGMQLEVLW